MVHPMIRRRRARAAAAAAAAVEEAALLEVEAVKPEKAPAKKKATKKES